MYEIHKKGNNLEKTIRDIGPFNSFSWLTLIRGISYRVPEIPIKNSIMLNKMPELSRYCLNIFVFQKQFIMTLAQEKVCCYTCIFIIVINIYIERWFRLYIDIESAYQFIYLLIYYLLFTYLLFT